MNGHPRGQVLGEDVEGARAVGAIHPDAHVQTPGAQDGGVDHVRAVGGADDDDVVEGLDAVHLCQQLRDDHRLHVGGHARAARAEQRLHLVKEDDDGGVCGRERARAGEDRANLPLGLAHELVEQLRALDRQEERRGSAAPGQGVRDRLGDECLARPGRAVQKDSLGRAQAELTVELGVIERHLDGVAHLGDLRVEASDVPVGHVGHLGGEELLDVLAHDAFERDTRACIHDEGIPGAQVAVT